MDRAHTHTLTHTHTHAHTHTHTPVSLPLPLSFSFFSILPLVVHSNIPSSAATNVPPLSPSPTRLHESASRTHVRIHLHESASRTHEPPHTCLCLSCSHPSTHPRAHLPTTRLTHPRVRPPQLRRTQVDGCQLGPKDRVLDLVGRNDNQALPRHHPRRRSRDGQARTRGKRVVMRFYFPWIRDDIRIYLLGVLLRGEMTRRAQEVSKREYVADLLNVVKILPFSRERATSDR